MEYTLDSGTTWITSTDAELVYMVNNVIMAKKNVLAGYRAELKVSCTDGSNPISDDRFVVE